MVGQALQSPELAALRHLGRAYGLGVRRSRRVGPVTYNLGIRGATRVADQSVYGSVTLTDSGKLLRVTFAGKTVSYPSLVGLSNLLELGTYVDEKYLAWSAEPAPLVLDEAPATGPIDLPVAVPSAPVPEGLALVETATTADIVLPGLDTTTVSVPVVVQPTLSVPVAALEASPAPVPAWRAWAHFIGGVLLVLLFAAVLLAGGAGAALNGWAVAMSVVAGTVGAVVMLRAISENDERLAALEPVGSM